MVGPEDTRMSDDLFEDFKLTNEIKRKIFKYLRLVIKACFHFVRHLPNAVATGSNFRRSWTVRERPGDPGQICSHGY